MWQIPTNPESRVSVILLTGGGSTRFGSDKAAAALAGESLLNHVLTAIPDQIEVVVVGPEIGAPPRPVRVTREDPPGGGPVAGVLAGLKLVSTSVVCVLATDMPAAAPVGLGLAFDLVARRRTFGPAASGPAVSGQFRSPVDRRRDEGAGPDGLIPLDGEGRRQPLCGAYTSSALRSVAEDWGTGHGRSMRQLLAFLRIEDVELEPGAAHTLFDIDTRADLVAAEQAIMAGKGADSALPRLERTDMIANFADAAAKALGIETDVNVDTILDVAKDAAHGVERPAAPVTTYLLGYAVAQGMNLDEAAAKLSELAKTWASTQS